MCWPFNLLFIKPTTVEYNGTGTNINNLDGAIPLQQPNPYDCITKAILKDLDIVDDWVYECDGISWEYFRNRKKGYSITCYRNFGEACLSTVSSKLFSYIQRKSIYKKCQNVREKQQISKNELKDHLEREHAKSLFPNCFE